MKKPHVVLYAVLLVAGALGVVLLTQPHKQKKKPRRRPEARSVQPRPPRAARPEKTRLSGTVRRRNGTPIKGATVFVLPKKRAGGIRDKLPHEVTNESGVWTLRARNVEKSWIGVVAAGYRHAWLDGAAWQAGAPLLHEMERAAALRVTLHDAGGRPIRKKGIQLEPWPPRTTYFLPGPNARQGERWKVTDPAGAATFRVGDSGPVTLTPHVEGFHTEGGAIWLARPEGDVTVRMLPSRSLHLTLEAAESGAPIRDIVTVDLHRKDGGGLALSYTDSPDAQGTVRIDRAIRPGVFAVHVHGEGRASAILPGIEIDGGEKPAHVSVRLAAAPKPATLRLDLGEGMARTGPRGRPRRAPLVFLFRPAEVWRSHGWEPGGPESWDAASAELVLELPPDRYHVLVADVLSRRAALLQNVELAAGATVEAQAVMRVGLRASVNALIAANGKTRRVEVAGVGVGTLPVYGITSDGRIRVSRSADVLGRVDEGLGVYLGPYPFELMTIRVTGWDGSVVTHDVER